LELGGFSHLYLILISADITEMIAPSAVVSPNGSQGVDPTSKKQRARPQKQRSKLLKNNVQQAAESLKKAHVNQTDQTRCLSLLISIVKIFLNAALLTVDYENLLSLVVQSSTSPFRSDRKKTLDAPQLEQLVTQGLAEKPHGASYGRESDGGSRAENTSGTGTPKFGSD